MRTLQPEYTFGYLGRATGVTESPHGDVFEPRVYVPQVFAWVLVVAQFLEAGGQSTTDSKGETSHSSNPNPGPKPHPHPYPHLHPYPHPHHSPFNPNPHPQPSS